MLSGKTLQEQENTMHTAAFRKYGKLAMWECRVLHLVFNRFKAAFCEVPFSER